MLHYKPYFDKMLGLESNNVLRLDDITNNIPAKYRMPNLMQQNAKII